jgi:hypothetical protein
MLCARCSCLLVRASKSPKHLAGYLTLRDSVSQQAGLAGTPALFAIAGLPALLDNSKLTLFDRRFEMSSKGHFFKALGTLVALSSHGEGFCLQRWLQRQRHGHVLPCYAHAQKLRNVRGSIFSCPHRCDLRHHQRAHPLVFEVCVCDSESHDSSTIGGHLAFVHSEKQFLL